MSHFVISSLINCLRLPPKKHIEVSPVLCCPSSNIKREGKKSVEVKTRHFGRLAPSSFFAAMFADADPISHF